MLLYKTQFYRYSLFLLFVWVFFPFVSIAAAVVCFGFCEVSEGEGLSLGFFGGKGKRSANQLGAGCDCCPRQSSGNPPCVCRGRAAAPAWEMP